jgi:hypothetical protein
MSLEENSHVRLGRGRSALSQGIARRRWYPQAHQSLTIDKEITMMDWEKVEARCRKALLGGGGAHRPIKV